MFEHRLALALGRTVAQLGRMSEREMQRWHRYWIEEPWGTYRDNLHAAMIAVELRRPQARKGSKLSIDTFMWKPKDTAREKRAGLNAKLLAIVKAKAVRP